MGVIRFFCSPGFRSAESRFDGVLGSQSPISSGRPPIGGRRLYPPSSLARLGPSDTLGSRSAQARAAPVQPLSLARLGPSRPLGSRSAQARAAPVQPLPVACVGPSDPLGSRSAQACAAPVQPLSRSPRSLPSSRLALCLGLKRRSSKMRDICLSA